MNIIYNTQDEIATKVKEFLLKVFPDIRKTHLKIIPFIFLAIILSESLVASDLSKQLKGEFSLVQHDSIVKRIRRFFKNKFFDPYLFYEKIISYVISNYKKKHPDKRVHIIFDHMYSNDIYTVFMITMRIGKQGIPLWFRCFKNSINKSDAFEEELLKEGISFVSSLFGSEFDLIFLADRWFNSISLLKHIDSLGHTFNIRFKKNIKVLIYDKKEGHKVWKWLNNLTSYKYESNLLYDVELSEYKYTVNIAISKQNGHSEPWIIITNSDPKRSIKDYSYRFGGIESVFKNQKTNGLYLENTVNASQKYFESMYSMACFVTLYLTLLGSDFTKNTKCYKNVKITTQLYSKDKTKKRILSLFNTGLTLFHKAFNSSRYIRLPFTFILYDS